MSIIGRKETSDEEVINKKRRYMWKIVGTVVLLALFLVVFLFLRVRNTKFSGGAPPLTGHDTPIVIAGGSIRAHCYASHKCDAVGWVEAPQDSTSYIVKVFASIKEIEVTEKTGTDEDDETRPEDPKKPDYPKSDITIPNAVNNDWMIEIDTSDSAGQPYLKAIKIRPDLTTDTTGKTLRISITDNPPTTAKWEPASASGIRYRGNHETCVADGSTDPRGNCDKLGTVHVTLRGAEQAPVTCETGGAAGKCKIKLKA